MAYRPARNQTFLTILALFFLGWITLHGLTHGDEYYSSLRYPFREDNADAGTPPLPQPLEEADEPPLPDTPEPEPVRQSSLPEFCDYCGLEDELCQKYGESNLARALAFEGGNARLKRVIRKAMKGGKIKIGIIGGSVTAGHGVHIPDRWATLYAEWWRRAFPNAEVELVNGAVPASETNYYMTCFGEHIDEDVDLVVVEMGINDRRFEILAQSYEFLLRALLELPNQPAVINLHIIALSFATITMGGDLHAGIAMYYDSPIISLRNLLLPHILAHPSSGPPNPEEKYQGSPPHELESHWFTLFGDKSADLRHINKNGHRMAADLLEIFTRKSHCAVLREGKRRELGISEGGAGYDWMQFDSNLPGNEVLFDIPRVRIFDKYDSYTKTPPVKPICMSTTSQKHPLVPIESQTKGWTRWAPVERPDKIYIRATEPGSRVAFPITVGTAGLGNVRVTFLRSKTFGMGSVLCWIAPRWSEEEMEGKSEEEVRDREDEGREKGARWDGWWDIENINVGSTEDLRNVAPGEHILRCELLSETKDPGGGHDFRILAVHAL